MKDSRKEASLEECAEQEKSSSSVEQLLKNIYGQGEHPADALNRTVIEKVKERESMKNQGLKTGKYKKIYRRGMRRCSAVAAAFFAVLIIAGGVCAANGYFGLDFFATRYDKNAKLSDDAKKLIEEKPEVTIRPYRDKNAGPALLDYQVTEALCDHRFVAVTVEVSLKDPEKYLLVGEDDFIPDQVVDYRLHSGSAGTQMKELSGMGIDSRQTVEEYCREHGKKWVGINFVSPEDSVVVQRGYCEYQYSGTGKLTAIFRGERQETKKKDFVVEIVPKVSTDVTVTGKAGDQVWEYKNYNEDMFKITVHDNSKEQTAQYRIVENVSESKKIKEDAKGNAFLPGPDISVEKIELTSTEVGSYATVFYRPDGLKGDAKYMYFMLSDKEGNRADDMILGGGGSLEFLGNGLYKSESIGYSIGLPEEIYLESDWFKVYKAVKQ